MSGLRNIFSKNATKAGKSALKLLRNTDNLIHIFGETVGKQIAKEWSPCCGLCRRQGYFVDGNGQPTNLNFNDIPYDNQIQVANLLTKLLGNNFILYIYQTGNFMILGTEKMREAGCTDEILSEGEQDGFSVDENGQITFNIEELV